VTRELDIDLWGVGSVLGYIRISFCGPNHLNSVSWTNVSSANRQNLDIPETPSQMGRKKKDEARREQGATGRDGQADRQNIRVGGLLNMGRVADELSAE